MNRLAALTGGAGFLGRHTIRALADDGWRIRMLARSAPHLPELADVPIEIVLGDLGDETALARLARGADALIHIAGVVKAKDEATFMRINADGAAAMARAWRAAAPEAGFTLVSSMAAREPGLSAYAASKRAGEARVAEIAGDGRWRIARPGAVYGAYDEESLKVLKLANAPVQLMLNAPEARVGMIDARDAARALVAMAATPGAGEVFELTDARIDGHRWDELVAVAAGALAHAPRPFRLPAGVLRLIGAVGGGLAGATGSAEMLTSGKVREILHPDWSARAEAVPPVDFWRPRIALEDGLADMVAWARAAGRL